MSFWFLSIYWLNVYQYISMSIKIYQCLFLVVSTTPSIFLSLFRILFNCSVSVISKVIVIIALLSFVVLALIAFNGIFASLMAFVISKSKASLSLASILISTL